jgi:pyruvate formate lyase activating enzyme
MTDKSVKTHVYHITYAPEFGVCCLYFWGCNLRCRLCLLKKEAFDCHLPENRLRIYDPAYTSSRPDRFLTFAELFELLDPLPLKQVVLMGAEPVCDPRLPDILESLKEKKGCSIVLLTNGRKYPPLTLVDQVVFSIKAVTPELHLNYTGEDNTDILRNFSSIAAEKTGALQTETVFIPGYIDEEEVLGIAGFIASVDPSVPFRIDAYLPVPYLPWRAPTVEEISRLRDKAVAVLPGTTCFYGDEGNTPLAYEVKRIF